MKEPYITDQKPELHFAILAYNEELNIEKVIQRLLKSKQKYNINGNIFIINDASTDQTADIIRKYLTTPRVQYIGYKTNIGFGSSYHKMILTGIKQLQQKDYLLFLEGDNTTKLEFLPQILKYIKKDKDIIICSRYHPRSKNIKVPLERKIGSYFMNKILKIYFRTGITDHTLMYKTYKIKFLNKISHKYHESLITQKRFTAITELLLKSLTLNPNIKEIPIQYIHDEREGKSKMKILK